MIAELHRAVEPESQRVPGIVLRDRFDGRRDRRLTDQRIGGVLDAAKSILGLLKIMIAGESADAKIAAANNVIADIDAAIAQEAAHFVAGGRGIRRQRRRKIFVLELSLGGGAAANVTFDEPTARKSDAPVEFAGINQHPAVSEPRHQPVIDARHTIKVLAGLACAEPVSRAKFGLKGRYRVRYEIFNIRNRR